MLESGNHSYWNALGVISMGEGNQMRVHVRCVTIKGLKDEVITFCYIFLLQALITLRWPNIASSSL